MTNKTLKLFKDLLEDAVYLYKYYPNNFKKTPKEYFDSYFDFIQMEEEKTNET